MVEVVAWSPGLGVGKLKTVLCQDWLHNPKDKGLTPLFLFMNSTLGLASMGFNVPSYVKKC